MSDRQLSGTKALQALVGLPLSVTSYAGNMRKFGFGKLRTWDGGMIGKYSLHLQCPWRISQGHNLVTGSNDWYLPEDESDFEKISDESWDPAHGGSLQDATLRRLFNHEGSGLGYIVNETDDLIVTRLSVDSFGGFEILLSPGYALTAFPASSRNEHWRLFRPDGGPHFVVEADSKGGREKRQNQ